jgi:hypothetical protein
MERGPGTRTRNAKGGREARSIGSQLNQSSHTTGEEWADIESAASNITNNATRSSCFDDEHTANGQRHGCRGHEARC